MHQTSCRGTTAVIFDVHRELAASSSTSWRRLRDTAPTAASAAVCVCVGVWPQMWVEPDRRRMPHLLKLLAASFKKLLHPLAISDAQGSARGGSPRDRREAPARRAGIAARGLAEGLAFLQGL